jgi:hypothetical protein
MALTTRRRTWVACYALGLTAFLTVLRFTYGQERAPDQIVTVGPSGPLTRQVEYLKNTWPDQFAIAVVEALRAPKCDTPDKTTTRYCWLDVRPTDLIFIRWLNKSPPAPADRFTIHFWYQGTASQIVIGQGDQLVVFLAPTHGRGTFAATVLMRSDDEITSSVRSAVNEAMR